MAVTTFIPELWSARLLNALDKSHVATNLVNRDYEGLISQQGDTVHINTIGAVTINSYTRNTDIAGPEALTTSDQSLEIDQAKYFNFQVDDVDAAQAAGDILDAAMGRAAYGLADVADAFLLAKIANGVDSGNVIGSNAEPIELSSSNVYDYMVALAQKLDEANVPNYGRSVVIPPAVYALLLKDDRFVKAGNPATGEVVLNGLVGSVAGLEVYKSNNCVKTSNVFTVTAQIPAATTYAEQITKTEAYRPEGRFADAIKGLHLYGAKVTDGKMIAALKCTV